VLLAPPYLPWLELRCEWWRLSADGLLRPRGIFLQVLWSGLQGHPFESTALLPSSPANVIHAGEAPGVG